jgi:hypothetical protein
MTDGVAPTKAETSSPGAANPSSTSPSPTNAAQNPDGVGGAGTLPTVNTEGGGPSGSSSEPAPTTAPAETGCQGLDLEVGETSADGIQLLYAPEEFSAYLKGLGLTSEHLYFRSGSALMRLPLAGGGAEVVATLEIDPLLVHGERLYTSKSNDDGTVDLGVAALADPTMNVVIAPGVTVRDFDADDDAAYYSAAEAGIFRAPADGSGPVLVTQRFAEGMIVHEGYIYFIDSDNETLERVAVTGGEPEQLASAFFDGVFDAEGSTVVWGDDSEETINAWEQGATTRTILASLGVFDSPDDVALHGSDVYWVSGGFGCDELFSVPLAGGEKRRVSYGYTGVDWIADTDSHMYLVGDAVWSAPLP